MSPERREAATDDDAILEPERERAPWHRSEAWWKANAPEELWKINAPKWADSHGPDEEWNASIRRWREWQQRRAEYLAETGQLTPGEFRWLWEVVEYTHPGQTSLAKQAQHILQLAETRLSSSC